MKKNRFHGLEAGAAVLLGVRTQGVGFDVKVCALRCREAFAQNVPGL